MIPPSARKIKKELYEHGKIRIDNYFWLNQRDNPEVLDYLKQENAYTEAVMGHLSGLREKLYDEMVSRIKQQEETVPYFENGYYYYSRYEPHKEYPVFCRSKDKEKTSELILLNVNNMAEGHDYFNVTGLAVNPENKILAFGTDKSGSKVYDINFKDLDSGNILPDILKNTTGYPVWADDGRTLFYSLKDDSLRAYKIFRHKLGTPQLSDKEIFHEQDSTYAAHVFKSKSKKYILIGSYSSTSTEFRYLPSSQPESDLKIIQPREKEHEYYAEHGGNRFYIITNWNAVNFRLMTASENETGKENWKEIIPSRPNIFLESMEIFKNFLVVSERKNGLKSLTVINSNNNSRYQIDFEEETYNTGIFVNREFDTGKFRFYYDSFTTPFSVFEIDMFSKERTLLKREEVLGDFNQDNYVSERIFVGAADGTKVPVSMVYKKGIKKDGSNPLLLYGYGSYGISSDPDFNSVRLSLLDRGFIFAIAHIRGGQEMGRPWYYDGRLLNKKNSFTDFISCAESLINNNYTSKNKLFAAGGSAGGLLMGAAVNMRPDLFKGIIAAVPFVDIISTMLDESLPLTAGEYDEWGNPNKKEFYDYMLSYSPYDNVQPRDYPAMLVTTGLNDSQVQYWEPAKWVAKLRDMKTDKNTLLLHTNISAGHGGASGRFERFKLIALEYAFILDQIGIYE